MANEDFERLEKELLKSREQLAKLHDQIKALNIHRADQPKPSNGEGGRVSKTTIVFAEDHRLVREGLKHLLADEPDFKLVGEAGDGPTAVELVLKLKPTILVLDLVIPGLHGLEVIRQLRHQNATKIVVVSMHADPSYVLEALNSGAFGYVVKDSPSFEIIQAVRMAVSEQFFISPALKSHALTASLRTMSKRQLENGDHLTNRERLVLQMATEGNTNKMIAAKLSLSPKTVESHRRKLMHKLGLKTQTDLVRYAVRKGLISE